MVSQRVRFSYRPSLSSHRFANVRLSGSWDPRGRAASVWSTVPMTQATDPDGCPCFDAEVDFDATQVGQTFRWGVTLDAPAGPDLWGIAAEVDDEASTDRVRSFVLSADLPTQVYYLTQCYRLGAVKTRDGQKPGIRFSLWAPNAKAVDLVLADPAHGYVADDGTGTVRSMPMSRAGSGIWQVGAAAAPALADFSAVAGTPYMFRVTKDDGTVAYRTDIYSLMQIGQSDVDPAGRPYTGPAAALEGPQSCSVVCDPDVVQVDAATQVAAAEFWRDEYDPRRPLPTRLEDLVIYELHVGALGFGRSAAGTLDDAIALVDHLTELGVNAVELLPIAEFAGIANWGYGSAQFMAIDQAAGGTDRLKHFVKTCHQRGIAVILDVCYNHFDPNAERAQWQYDSNDPTKNIYFWYEGRPGDYKSPDGGYLDNESTGYAPRYSEEMVRQVFISSAALLVEVCHVDGFRLDQTSSIHEYNALHADGRSIGRANAFGVKFLKQWTRTMRLLGPGLFLTAEDYSNWPAMTAPSLGGDGLGFDATWYGDFQHHLVQSDGFAELVKQSGFGDDRSLRMDLFAGALRASGGGKVVYPESHDDCGNRRGSARTIVLAVNRAPLTGETRRWAEARLRFSSAIALLSAGTPMFFMGEEIGAQKPYTYDTFLHNREDILGDATGIGATLFGYFKSLIRFSIDNSAIRSRNIDVGYADNANRVIAFHRWADAGEYLVVGCLANAAFAHGYWLHTDRLGGFGWTEVFNTDSGAFGGWNVGNDGRTLCAVNGALNAILPAAGVLVFRRA